MVHVKYQGKPNFCYKTGDQYQYLRGRSQGSVYMSTGLDFGISPTTHISSIPTNLNVQIVGLGFGLDEIFSDDNIHWMEMSDSLFRMGARTYCNQGFSCSDGNHINRFWNPGSLQLNSSLSRQPSDSCFMIVTVTIYHHVTNLNLTDYYKIIGGRVQCKVFSLSDASVSKLLINGQFRMPVWRNSQDGH